MWRWSDRASLRLRSLLRGTRVDQALRREIQAHIDEQVAENIARGMNPEDARSAALRAFGSAARVTDECRDMRRVALVENFGRDIRYTIRTLARQPLLLLAATLSIGA